MIKNGTLNLDDLIKANLTKNDNDNKKTEDDEAKSADL